MIDLFPMAVNVVLDHEQGFVDLNNDRGGPTNFGLTLEDLDAADLPATVEVLKALTEDQACVIYRKNFWTRQNFDELVSPEVAIALFDQTILSGAIAIMDLQKILGVKADGKLGAITLEAIAKEVGTNLTFRFLRQRARHFTEFTQKNPSQIEFLSGWIDRIFSLIEHLFNL